MAKINTDDIDTLRERANVVDVISGYTQLKKSGGHTYKGLCPFHSEKTPSFTVDAARGLFFCFGCSEGGNVYHFIQKVENLAFPDAVEWLARKEGFGLRYEEMRPGERQAAGIKLRLVEANRVAAEFFHGNLVSAPQAEPARRYLESRGFGRAVAERWQLGFAPGGDLLCGHLRKTGFSEAEIVQADLGRKSDRNTLYDTFRSRIVFPTRNERGDVVGFGARALGKEQPKYLNTSETPVFAKSRVMYGLDRAKSAIARGGVALVVEGYTDVIALHEAGVDIAVATNGVALGESHFNLLRKFAERIVLMFDADAAGAGATERAFELQHRVGIEVLVAPLPGGRDPAEVVSEDGVEAVHKTIDAAQPLMEFKLEQMLARMALDTPEARSRAVRQTVEVLGWHPDPIARHEYAFVAARRIGVEPAAVHSELSQRERRAPEEVVEKQRRLPGHVKVEREALLLLLTRTQEAGPWAEETSSQVFTSPARRELFERALSAFRSREDPHDLVDTGDLSPEAVSLLTELTVGAEQANGRDPGKVAEVFTRLKVFSIEREIKGRRNVLQEINPLDDPSRHDELFTELVALEAQRRDLLRGLQEAL